MNAKLFTNFITGKQFKQTIDTTQYSIASERITIANYFKFPFAGLDLSDNKWSSAIYKKNDLFAFALTLAYIRDQLDDEPGIDAYLTPLLYLILFNCDTTTKAYQNGVIELERYESPEDILTCDKVLRFLDRVKGSRFKSRSRAQ